MNNELKTKMTRFANQVWFRSMPEESQRQAWYNELATQKREEELARQAAEAKKKQEEQERKLKELSEKKKKIQGRHLHDFGLVENLIFYLLFHIICTKNYARSTKIHAMISI